MKRLLALAVLAGSLAATAVPSTAAPWCGPRAGVKCTPDGWNYCLVYLNVRNEVCV